MADYTAANYLERRRRRDERRAMRPVWRKSARQERRRRRAGWRAPMWMERGGNALAFRAKRGLIPTNTA